MLKASLVLIVLPLAIILASVLVYWLSGRPPRGES
jgi:hypothetical protein